MIFFMLNCTEKQTDNVKHKRIDWRTELKIWKLEIDKDEKVRTHNTS